MSNTYDQQPDIRMPRIVAGIPSGGYKQYTALLNQSTTSAPVATILNNQIGNIVWTRFTQGVYRATLNGAFTQDKTFVIISNTENPGYGYECHWASANMLEFVSLTETGGTFVEADSIMINLPIEIRVYESNSNFQFSTPSVAGPQIYRALLTQSSTGAPTAIILETNFVVIPVYSYTSTGNYKVTVTGMNLLKTSIQLGPTGGDSGISYNVPATDDYFTIVTSDNTGTPTDDFLYLTTLEIIIYP